MRKFLRSHLISGILPAPENLAGLSKDALLRFVKAAVAEADLTAVGEVAVSFEPYGTSVVVVLKESHVALHYWPESQNVTIDIHVCDYLEDNAGRARTLAQALERALGHPLGRGWVCEVLSS